MPKLTLFLRYLVLSFFLCGCSINLAQTAAPTNAVASAAPVSTPPANNPAVSSGKKIGDPTLPTTSIPVTWGALKLSGKLVYMNSVQDGSNWDMSIRAVDLVSGQVSTIFQAPPTAWIDFMSVAPDESQLIMAYLPPRPANLAGGTGQQALYVLPLDGSKQPEMLFAPPGRGDQYFQPTWSSDGKYVYFAHVDYSAPPKVPGQHFSYYEIYRMLYPGGQPQKLVDTAYWPRLSHDGARLAYVTLDPADGSNKLYVANPDGSGAYQVNLSGLYVPPIIDAPFFALDDRSVLYSAVTPTQSSQPNWLERLLGLQVASAHTVPSDWWSVPIGGGTPTQLTHIAAVGLFASPAPDGNYVASYSGSGIFVMKPDGTELTMLVTDMGGLAGTLTWIP